MSQHEPIGCLEAALQIAQRRAVQLEQLREALVREDNEQALTIAKQLCGLNDEKKSDSAYTS